MEWEKLEEEQLEFDYEGHQIKCPNCNDLIFLSSIPLNGHKCPQCNLQIELGIRYPNSVDVKEVRKGDVEVSRE